MHRIIVIGILATASLYSAALPDAGAQAQNKKEIKFITRSEAEKYVEAASIDFMRNYREDIKKAKITEDILLKEVANLIQKYGFIKDAKPKKLDMAHYLETINCHRYEPSFQTK
jgi:hypothetical protein